MQPSAYGRDNACMLDAMREVGHRACRGIVDVDENAPDAVLAELDALGVRGVRINVSPVKPPEPGFSETMLPRIERLDARCAELGWHLDFLTPGWLTEELLPVFAKMRCSFSLAHMGMFLRRGWAAAAGLPEAARLPAPWRRPRLGEAHRHLPHGDAAGASPTPRRWRAR